jgi:hypothetical protein
MATSETELKLLRFQIRLDVLQSIVLQLVVASPVAMLKPSQDRQQELLQRLEEVAQKGEQFFLLSGHGDDAQRALYADELREVVEKMKKSLQSLSV